MAQANQGVKVNTKPEITTLNDGSTFIVNQLINGVLKVRQFTKEKFIEQFLNPENTAAVFNYSEFLAANNDASKTFIIIGSAEIDLEANVLNLKSNKVYFFNNTTLVHTSETSKFISAVGIENFIITGKLNIVGTRVTNETNTTEIGIFIDDCDNYIVENVTITNIRGYAVNLASNSVPAIRGNKGKFDNLNLDLNNYPMYINAGSGAEYNLFSNISATQNENPFSVFGGNNMFVSCNIVDNTKGVYLGSGANHAHGIFNGCNINHNTDYNLLIENVTLGQNFNGCHFYGDSVGGLGKIKINSSKGININNGHIDAYIEIVNGANSGLNYISNNFIDGTYTSLNGDGLSKLVCKGNFTGTAPSAINTISSVYVEASRTGAQSIATDDNIIFNTEQFDLLGAYDSTTGIFTAPYNGLYNFNINALFTGTAINASASYVGVIKNASVYAYLGVSLGGSIALVNGNFEIKLLANETLRFPINFSGSNLAVDAGGSFIKIRRIE